MKASSATSAKAGTAAATRTIAPSSAKRRLTPTADEFALAGPSDLPDARFHAYRKDLADVALAGQVIASHYAEPVPRRLATATALLDAPAPDGVPVVALEPGDAFMLLDDSLGWAWGYGGNDGLVGYVPSEVLTP